MEKIHIAYPVKKFTAGNAYGMNMSLITADRQIQGKKAELAVFGELLERGAIPYLPLTDVEGVDAVVSIDGGELLRIQIKAAGINGGKDPKWFQVNKLNVADDFFVVCVEAPNGIMGDVWVFPSKVFDAYANLPPKGTPRDLNLDLGKRKYGLPLYDILCGFRNRWELITEYESFKDLLDNPEDLEDVLTMQEALEAPEEEIMTLEEYEQLRKAKI